MERERRQTRDEFRLSASLRDSRTARNVYWGRACLVGFLHLKRKRQLACHPKHM